MNQREIKFRAWDKASKEMRLFSPIRVAADEGGTPMLQMAAKEYGPLGLAWHNKPASDWNIMQFTGLKDKNGKEIYEGDILEEGLKDSGNQVVEWIGNGFWCHKGDDNYMPTEKHREVIGNIYENKELLKS